MLVAARRSALAMLATMAALSVDRPRSALAAQGAAEMDLEFYLRGALGRPPPPPATPQAPLRPRLLDGVFVARAVEAVEATLSEQLSLTPTALREAAASRRRGQALEYNRVLLSGAFGDGSGYDAAAAVETATSSSQFGFDLTLLCLFSILADARVPKAEAAVCAQRLGSRLLAAYGAPPTSVVTTASAPTPPIAELIGGMRALLGQLRTAGYVSQFAIDDSDVDEGLWSARSSLSPTRLTVTLTDSASLRAALLLNGRPGASPELAKPLLLAYLRARAVDVTEVNEFFLDSVYRPSPLDYQPNQQILTMTIAPGKSQI